MSCRLVIGFKSIEVGRLMSVACFYKNCFTESFWSAPRNDWIRNIRMSTRQVIRLADESRHFMV